MAALENSPSEQPAQRRPRRALKVFLALLAIFVAVDIALCYILEPYGGYSEVVWSEYYKRADQPIETVLVGSSYAQFDFDPTAIEDGLASPTYSLATPAQSVANSYSAIERAIADHQPRRVILAIAYDTFVQKPWINSAITFTQNKIQGEPLPDAVRDVFRLFTDTYFYPNSFSLVALFPWSVDHAALTPRIVWFNVCNRLQYRTALEASRVVFPDLPFDDKGRAADDGLLDFNAVESVKTAGFTTTPESSVVESYERICSLCEESGVELYVVVTPRPMFETLAAGSYYPQAMSMVQDIARDHGANYLDFNLAKPDYYRPAESEFKDADHLNLDGAVRFDGVLTQAIKSIEDKGAPVEKNFFAYGEWDEFLASVDTISTVTFSSSETDAHLQLEATPYAGPGVQVEYEFSVVDAAGGERVVRPYSADPCCTVPVDGHGSLTVTVRARQAGSSAPYEKLATHEVLF